MKHEQHERSGRHGSGHPASLRFPCERGGAVSLPEGGTRRDFLRVAGLGVASTWIVACGGDGNGEFGPTKTGSVSGIVLDLQGAPQANFGQAILMFPSGRHVGVRVTPDAQGRFRFNDLPEGEYQIRFHSFGQAIIPEPYQHPIKFAVSAGKATDVTVRVVRGNFQDFQVEIYIGDDFYQLQPDGAENAETVVKLGTPVCWYNVGVKVHTVTGGPWNDSGDLQKTQSYIWVANQVGSFGYRCKYNQPQMQSTLRVIP
jgi:Carboxypeptidase regulatory-like domain